MSRRPIIDMNRSGDQPETQSGHEQTLRAEALRVYHRYVTEVVEPLGLCPWAKRARLDGHVTHRVITDAAPALREDVLPHVDAVARDMNIEVGLLIFPRLALDPTEFRRFAGQVRQLDAERYATGEPTLYMADFHPEAPLDMQSPARLVAFIRRSPDPTIQLVRRTVLNAVRKNDRSGTLYLSPEQIASGQWQTLVQTPLHERIADTNYATIRDHGIERLRALLDDIHRDRDDAYARLGIGRSRSDKK